MTDSQSKKNKKSPPRMPDKKIANPATPKTKADQRIKLIIFDWDDVIVTGAKEGYFDCYHEAIKSVGVKLDAKDEHQRILDKWSKTNYEEIKNLVRERPELTEKAFKNFEKVYWKDTFVKHQKLIKGSRMTLKSLSKKYVLAVATSGNKKMIEKKVIPYFKIPNVFKIIISSEEMPSPSKMKPHPLILQTIMSKVGATNEETMYVGDANTDIQMALKAKVIPIAVLSGHLRKSEAQKEGAKFIIANITKLPSLLKKINK